MKGSRGNIAASTGAPKLRLLAALKDFQRAATLTAESKQVKAAVGVVRKFLWQQTIMEPWELTPDAIEAHLGELHASGRSAKTLINHRSALNSFCKFLVRRGLLTENPCADIQLRKPEEVLPRYLDDDEIAQVLRLAKELRIWPEICLPLMTGLRLSELIRLKWEDVDFARRCLTVQKSKSHRPRVIPLNRAAQVCLRCQRRVTGWFVYVFPARKTWRGCLKCRDPLRRFADRPRASNWWRRAMRPIQRAVPKFRTLPGSSTGRAFHLLRHTFASRLAQAGVSLYKIAQWLGHSDIRTTRIYAHLQVGFDPEIEAAAPK